MMAGKKLAARKKRITMDSLGDRMKKFERVFDYTIPTHLPVIIRVDGKGFSKLTKKIGAEKPFDSHFSNCMSDTMVNSAARMDGCVFGYTQSDEITFVLRNDQSLESEPWFGNRLQKVCSVASSIVTANFNKAVEIFDSPPAYFDARVFVVPSVDEMVNCLLWRQQDATKNSVFSACYYEVAKVHGKKNTRKMMDGLNGKQQQELLFKETGINWNDYETRFKRGTGCSKVTRETTIDGNKCIRSKWEADLWFPIFSDDRDYLKNIYLSL